MIKKYISRVLSQLDIEVNRPLNDISKEEMDIIKKVMNYTCTSKERVFSVINATNYVVLNNIQGGIVECGVWRGGSIMAAIYTLLQHSDTTREIYLFDTFEGMPSPSDKDIMYNGQKASIILDNTKKKQGHADFWCWATREDVQTNIRETGYPMNRVHFIKGMVEDTIPSEAPPKIALLRLDTDWYESTKHELIHLYSRLVKNGVLIIDDYGYWKGAREAVDEFFLTQPFKPLINRLDNTGRLIIKV